MDGLGGRTGCVPETELSVAWMANTASALTAPNDAAPETMGDFLAAWLAHMRGRVRRVTWEGYEVLIRRHVMPSLGHIAFGELSPLQLQQLYAHLLAGSEETPALSAGSVLN